jgi:hypothetical protein
MQAQFFDAAVENPPFCIVRAPILPQDRPPSVPTDSKGQEFKSLDISYVKELAVFFSYCSQVQNSIWWKAFCLNAQPRAWSLISASRTTT